MNIVDLIGNTPTISLEGLDSNVFVKLEGKNPGGSVKDRPVYAMLSEMLEKGEITPETTLVEASSGNTGIALAMLGSALGIKVIIVMPESMSQERKDLIKAYGATLHLTDAKLGMQGSVDAANEYLKDKNFKQLGQFDNKANPRVHYQTTGPELLEQVPHVDIFVAGFGTGGTISGVGKYLKEHNSNIKVIGVEPAKSPLITEKKAGPHKIQGIGANFVPENLDLSVVDEVRTVNDEDAFATVKRVGESCGVLVGISAGANIYTALQVAKENPGKVVATVAPDGVEKYLSMGVLA